MYMKDEKIVRNVKGKPGYKWRLPIALCFSHCDIGDYPWPTRMFFYYIIEYRCPKAGEYFISGAVPSAYYAKNDLFNKYLIAVPTKKAKRISIWVEAEQ